MSTNKKFALVLVGTCSFMGVLLFFFGGKENPYQVTQHRLKELEQAVTLFIDEQGRAPKDLSELGLLEEQLQDHLGEPFMYQLDDDSLTLISYGSDKKPGGHSFKQDYSVTIDIPRSK